ncbi:hypothetical protein GCM10027592_52800 [Spirosoma flavus]
MNTFVVATDFSANANKAVHFAWRLAHTQNAKLVLVNAFHFWPTNPAEMGGNFPLDDSTLFDDSQKRLHQLAKELQQRYDDSIPIQCITKEGYAIPALREVTETEKANLLIMSTVGSAPQSAQLLGSVATEMVGETAVPILLIPPSVSYEELKNVVLGIDLTTPPDALVFSTALGWARHLGCVVNVLCINDNPDDPVLKNRAVHVRQLLAHTPHTLTILPGKYVYKTLLGFAHANMADLLMMLPQSRNWFTRLLSEGETQRVARLTDIPLMAVV